MPNAQPVALYQLEAFKIPYRQTFSPVRCHRAPIPDFVDGDSYLAAGVTSAPGRL